jgi:hypothetical protein
MCDATDQTTAEQAIPVADDMCPGENTLVPLGVDVDGGKAFDLLVVVQPTVFKVSGAEFPESFLSDVESIQESWDYSSVPIQYQSLI